MANSPHEEILANWQKAFPRLPVAWLLCGAFGVGKSSLSYAMAEIVLSSPPKNNPNFLSIDEHKVESARQIKEFSQKAGKKVVIMENVQNMNKNAANALLKTLEETQNTWFFLISQGSVLPTIRSRCAVLYLPPAKDNVAKRFPDIPEFLHQGSIGKARILQESGLEIWQDLSISLEWAQKYAIHPLFWHMLFLHLKQYGWHVWREVMLFYQQSQTIDPEPRAIAAIYKIQDILGNRSVYHLYGGGPQCGGCP